MERLLERERELGVLDDVVRGVVAGRGCLVLVAGEAGIGKTSLVRALRERAGDDVAVLVGACEPLSVPVPLAPLRELAEAVGDLALAEAATADRLELARRLLADLTARAPVVAVVEDAHWADPTTLDVVRLLARRLEERPAAVVLTYRDDEVGANRELGQFLGDLATSPAVRRIRLSPLSEGAVRQLAHGAAVDAAGLARVTGGNPFLVVEAVAAGGGLPASVREAALGRVGRLGAEARAVVEAAAAIGQRVDPFLLEAVAPGSGPALEEALARGVLVAGQAALGFRHELIRAAIESAIPPWRRVELHGRVLAALAADPAVAPARLAHHAELAGRTEEACRYAALAAAEAERVGALREASLQSERALRLGAGLAPDERFELLVLHSRTTNFASEQLEDAVESAQAAVAAALELADPVREGRALLALTSAFWSCDRLAEARSAVERAVDVLDGTGALEERARAHAMNVRVEASAVDPAAAVELSGPALELARAAGLEEVRLDVEISLGLARGHLGDPEAPPLLAASASEARDRSLAIQTVRAYVNLVFVAAAHRRHALVDEATADALELFEGYQTTIPANAVRFYRARSLFDRGRIEEALAVATSPDLNVAADTPLVLALQDLAAARLGEPADEGQLERAWAALEHTPEGSRHGTVRTARVEAAWLRGDRASALRHAEDALAAPAASRFARSASDVAVWAARLGLVVTPPARVPAPVLAELAGDWRAAVRGWRELDAPYEAALAALPGDDRAARDALAALRRLGTDGAADAFARERAERGARTPRGPRRSTLAHPAGLTRREQEVLERLATGATNAAIASSLHLSERTVGHHVSSILRKLGATSRLAAVEQARRRGLLAQDR